MRPTPQQTAGTACRCHRANPPLSEPGGHEAGRNNGGSAGAGRMATVAPGALLTGPVCRRWTMRLLRLQRRAAATAYHRRMRAAARSGRTRLAPNSAPYVGGKSCAKRPVTRRCSSAVLLWRGAVEGRISMVHKLVHHSGCADAPTCAHAELNFCPLQITVAWRGSGCWMCSRGGLWLSHKPAPRCAHHPTPHPQPLSPTITSLTSKSDMGASHCAPKAGRGPGMLFSEIWSCQAMNGAVHPCTGGAGASGWHQMKDVRH